MSLSSVYLKLTGVLARFTLRLLLGYTDMLQSVLQSSGLKKEPQVIWAIPRKWSLGCSQQAKRTIQPVRPAPHLTTQTGTTELRHGKKPSGEDNCFCFRGVCLSYVTESGPANLSDLLYDEE